MRTFSSSLPLIKATSVFGLSAHKAIIWSLSLLNPFCRNIHYYTARRNVLEGQVTTFSAYTPQGLQLALGWEEGSHFVLLDIDEPSIVLITLVNCHGRFELVLEGDLFLPI